MNHKLAPFFRWGQFYFKGDFSMDFQFFLNPSFQNLFISKFFDFIRLYVLLFEIERNFMFFLRFPEVETIGSDRKSIDTNTNRLS